MAFAKRGIVAVQFLGDDEAEHRVTEELEPFVRFNLSVRGLVEVGPMVERLLQQLRVVETEPQSDGEFTCRPSSRYRLLPNHSVSHIPSDKESRAKAAHLSASRPGSI